MTSSERMSEALAEFFGDEWVALSDEDKQLLLLDTFNMMIDERWTLETSVAITLLGRLGGKESLKSYVECLRR